jgi:hypothetical protein
MMISVTLPEACQRNDSLPNVDGTIEVVSTAG